MPDASPPATPKRTRIRYVPTERDRELVTSLSGFGIPQEQICRLVKNPHTKRGIDKHTLQRHFRAELDDGIATANSQVAGACFKAAIAGDAAMIKWYMMNRMGWTNRDRQTLVGEDGAPAIKFENLTDAQLDIVIARLEKSLTGAGAG